jgi:copper transporter 1
MQDDLALGLRELYVANHFSLRANPADPSIFSHLPPLRPAEPTACFISNQWHITSLGGFVGTIIGVFFITLAVEATRRLSRDYDRIIKLAYYKREMNALAAYARNTNKEMEDVGEPAPFRCVFLKSTFPPVLRAMLTCHHPPLMHRPSTKEHLIRSAFYGVQFSAAC